MSDSIFIQSDAGRSKSKRAKQKNDCTVRAVVETTGLPYDEVYDILKEAGRKCGKGFHFKDWAPTAEVNGYVFKWKAFPAVKGQRRMNPVTFCRTFTKGNYIVKTAKHVFAIVDGKMRDTFQEHDDRCIYGCYEVVKAEAKVEKKKSVFPEKNSMPFADQIEIIKKLANKDLMTELNYLVNELDREEPEEGEAAYDWLDAFDDAYNQMEGNRKDCPRSYIDNMQDIAIAIGWYREVDDAELERTISTGKKYDLKFRNKKYKFNGRGGND